MRGNLRVFPCVGKRPLVKSWLSMNVSSETYEHKEGSYGIICDGFAVIDFDDKASRKDFPEGVFSYFCKKDNITLSELRESACLVKTPHGYHLYVAEDSLLKQGQGFKTKEGVDLHIDIRAQGRGYVIGPGSVVLSDGEKYEDEPKGTELKYEALSDFDRAPFRPLFDIFPSLYVLLAYPQQGKAMPSFAKHRGDRPDLGSNPFDGSVTWRPKTLYDGLEQLAAASEGERNQILFGVARFVKGQKGVEKKEKERRLDRVRKLALDKGLSIAEIDATIASAGYGKSAELADEALSDIELGDYIRNNLGAIVPNEYNLAKGLESGAIDISDFCIDGFGYLIHKPSRSIYKEPSVLHDRSEVELVKRLDWFFRPFSKSRQQLLKTTISIIREQNSEKIAEEFFTAIREDGEIVGVDQLWAHMGIEAKDEGVSIRWLEACLLQAVRRFFEHGSPLENIAILWGPQRTHKSTFISALFDPYFLDPVTSARSEDIWLTSTLSNDLRDEQTVGLKIRSMLCLELPELAALKRTSEIAAIRDFITRTADHYRAPYAPKAELQPRTCTFVGTSNEEPELGDQTGNRRFCLFHVIRDIDCKWIVENRVPIWRGLYKTYHEHPEKTVLTHEENEIKEKSLAINAFATLDYADYILEYLAKTPTGRLLRTDIENYLCNDEAGPRLRNTRAVKNNIDSVMATIGNKRRKGRYSSYLYTAEAKEKVRRWVDFEDEVDDSQDTLLQAQVKALEEENAKL